jgi:hypothetical protein
MPLRQPWTAALLCCFLSCFSIVTIGVLTKQIYPGDPGRPEIVAQDAASIGMAREGAGDASISPGVPLDDALGQALRALLKELLKQAIDQPGHLLIASLPIILSRYLTGVPWYGWPAIPLLAYREWLQWPSNRWWDPPLDWAFLALGVIVATWALDSLRRPRAAAPEADEAHPARAASRHG